LNAISTSASGKRKNICNWPLQPQSHVPTAGFVRRDYQQPIDEIIARVNLKELNRGHDELKRDSI
jgi:hypothetical protein